MAADPRPALAGYSVLPADASHFEGLHAALDSVAREKRYLALLQAPPRAEADRFFKGVVEGGHCLFVALREGAVAGWCDILPAAGGARAHVGVLGMGVVAAHRGRGLGSALLEAALAAAWKRGLTRIELAVRADNAAAIALYRRFGFAAEGLRRRSLRVDGEYCDAYAMALLRPDA